MAEPIEYRGKRDVVVEKLREAILHGKYKVGERLRQEEIAAELGISSTPVREALRVLETQGLVRHTLNRGVRVADFAGSIEQVYLLREALECLAAEMAVQNMTEKRAALLLGLARRLDEANRAGDVAGRIRAHARFHLVLYEGCDFPALIDMIKMLWTRHPWNELLSLPGLTSAHDHRAIAESAAARDAPSAADRLRAHLHAVRDAYAASLEERRAAIGANEVEW